MMMPMTSQIANPPHDQLVIFAARSSSALFKAVKNMSPVNNVMAMASRTSGRTTSHIASRLDVAEFIEAFHVWVEGS